MFSLAQSMQSTWRGNYITQLQFACEAPLTSPDTAFLTPLIKASTLQVQGSLDSSWLHPRHTGLTSMQGDTKEQDTARVPQQLLSHGTSLVSPSLNFLIYEIGYSSDCSTFVTGAVEEGVNTHCAFIPGCSCFFTKGIHILVR